MNGVLLATANSSLWDVNTHILRLMVVASERTARSIIYVRENLTGLLRNFTWGRLGPHRCETSENSDGSVRKTHRTR